MVKKNVLVNLIALIILLGGFFAFLFKNLTLASVLVVIGVAIYTYQRVTHSEV